MREATVSLLGMVNWDPTLLDTLYIPPELDKQILTENLLAETAELEILYTSPVVLKSLIGIWSRKQLPIWQHLYETTQYEYNPIENYDRNETGSDSGTGSSTHGGTDTHNISRAEGGRDTGSGSESGTATTNIDNDLQHKVAGFNSSTPVLATQDIEDRNSTGTHSSQSSQTVNYGKTESVIETDVYGHTITDAKSGTHTLRAHGNIGVTTTQEMIKQEREIALFNVYDIIIQDFIHRFCVMVY